MAKVLIVDDDRNNRLLLATLLEHAGHSPIEAPDGGTGAQIAFEELPDLIVVDLSLPDMPGTELIRRLRSDSRTKHTKIALYTATQRGPALDELVEIHAVDGVIPKPGDPREVLATFSRLLDAPS